MTEHGRTPTPTDALAEEYVATLTRLSPISATEMGLPGDETALDDFSPAGLRAQAEAAQEVLTALEGVQPTDEVDRITQLAMRERLGLELELDEAGENLGQLNVIASPLQFIREVFDMMPTETEEHWSNIAARMHAVPEAIEGYVQSLRLGARRGHVPARRQVEAGIAEAEGLASADSFFVSLAEGARVQEGAPPQPLAQALHDGARAAAQGYGHLARVLAELVDQAPEEDAVGRERYERFSRLFLGAEVDLDETYEWGLEQVEAIAAEQQAVAERISGPGATIAQAMADLDADPDRILHGTDGLQKWMQATAEEAISALDGEHFQIPEPVHRFECRIAPTHSGGIYYTPPSDDFSRPGRMWWSVPEGVTEFTTWREKTTVYHEGVPGHHLQTGQAAYQSRSLNTWRRMACWVSGHGEGWALYAERLMQDLGFLGDDGDLMGMLDSQRLRAARVVVDIGVHLRKPCPQRWGGGIWNAQKAWDFLNAHVSMEPEFLQFELNRYLGWPGQAPSYKVGQRLWEQLRDRARERAGADFDLAEFHRRALNVGSVGLDTLSAALDR